MMTCGECKYIRQKEVPLKNAEWVCKRYPPQLVAVVEGGNLKLLARWPIVRREETACGEFWAGLLS